MELAHHQLHQLLRIRSPRPLLPHRTVWRELTYRCCCCCYSPSTRRHLHRHCHSGSLDLRFFQHAQLARTRVCVCIPKLISASFHSLNFQISHPHVACTPKIAAPSPVHTHRSHVQTPEISASSRQADALNTPPAISATNLRSFTQTHFPNTHTRHPNLRPTPISRVRTPEISAFSSTHEARLIPQLKSAASSQHTQIATTQQKLHAPLATQFSTVLARYFPPPLTHSRSFKLPLDRQLGDTWTHWMSICSYSPSGLCYKPARWRSGDGIH